MINTIEEVSDSDLWRAYREQRRQKKIDNEKLSVEFLKERGIAVTALDETTRHYRVESFDFWPSTGKFYNQRTGERGRGVVNLIKRLKILQ